MNRIYNLVWNRALRSVQVASELATSAGGGNAASEPGAGAVRRHPLALACIAALALGAFALPAWSASCTINGVTYANCTLGVDGKNAVAAGVVTQEVPVASAAITRPPTVAATTAVQVHRLQDTTLATVSAGKAGTAVKAAVAIRSLPLPTARVVLVPAVVWERLSWAVAAVRAVVWVTLVWAVGAAAAARIRAQPVAVAVAAPWGPPVQVALWRRATPSLAAMAEMVARAGGAVRVVAAVT